MLSTCRPHLNKAVSIGGWCGPALMLGKLGIRTEAYPFDFSRVTMDGVIHFVENGFSTGFFPPGPPPYKPECVGMWVLFRGQHTAFAHFDLNDQRIKDAFNRKMERWDALLNKQDDEPVIFFRTVSARNPVEELQLISHFTAAVEKVNRNLNFRTVVTVHDQGFVEGGATDGIYVPRPATALSPIDGRSMLWAVEYNEGPEKTLFDRCQSGYGQVVTCSMDDTVWADLGKAALSAEGGHRLLGTHLHRRLNGGAHVLRREPPSITCTPTTEDAQPLEYKGAVTQLGEEDLSSWPTFAWRSHNNIALIDGVASVGGTCRGVGSTSYLPDPSTTKGDGKCTTCGNTDWHKAGTPFRTQRPFTDDEDDLLLIHLFKILTGGDKVEAVEQLAHEMNRGAFEVICRIQFLTSNSTKIADGIDMEDP